MNDKQKEINEYVKRLNDTGYIELPLSLLAEVLFQCWHSHFEVKFIWRNYPNDTVEHARVSIRNI